MFNYKLMNSIQSRFPVLIALFLSAIFSANAKPVPDNLANGLDKIVENNLIQQGQITAPAPAPTKLGKTAAARKIAARAAASTISAYNAMIAKEAASYAQAAITETATGKYLVEIMPDGRVPLATLQNSLQTAFPLTSVQHIDNNYAGHGVIEAYITVTDAPKMAQFHSVGSIILQLRPIHSVGAVTEYGVHMHRIDRINTLYNAAAAHNWDGTGMSIGVMSDSYNSQPSTEGGYTTAPQDVVSGDLPGTGNTVNPQPVVVLQDFNSPPNATNEGRAMCQIVADMAPKARIGFATADVGEVGFANNIRALAGLPGFTYPNATQQGFKGDVVCDDVSYIDEPMFQDGIVAQGVIDVVNAGVTYCSSAANNWGTDGYLSVFRPVPNGTGPTAATNSALAGTNINLATVPAGMANLYAGGFHNFNPAGLDVAQTINTANDAAAFVFQWNDPYDTSAPTLGPEIFSSTGTSTAGSSVDFHPPAFTAGQEYVITEMATPQTPADNLDAIVRVVDPNGNTILDQDTGVDETVTFFAPVSGNYTVTVHPYATPLPAGGGSVPTQGPFSIKINTASGVARITQDFNLLFFDPAGNFISALGSNSIANNRPYELSVPTFNADGFTQVQMVICRSNTTAPANAANQLKYVYFGNGLSGVGPAEYGNILTPVTYGHSAAAGANSIAAYSGFRPNIPEDFTSPGPVSVYFDTNNNRLATPEIRQKPDIAAMDASNNTFFPIGPAPVIVDSAYDSDSFPNFSGTSAASPHAAALAALVLQAHGGSNSLTPAQVKTIFQLTAFPHDLNPYQAAGTATAGNGATVSVNVVSDNSRNTGTGSKDPNTFSVSYNGPGRLATLSFNPEGTAGTGGNTTGGNFSGNPSGNMPADFMNSLFYKYTPGMIWLTAASNYSFGSSTGLVAGDVTHTYANPAPFPSNPSPGNTTQHMWTLNLAFSNNNFTTGKVLRFNNGRGPQQDATVPQGQTVAALVRDGDFSADMLGGGLLLPEFADSPVIAPGMTFSGTIVDGATTYPFSGRLNNVIGRGYSTLDGYGFINAEAATALTLPTPGVVSRKNHGPASAFDIDLPVNGPVAVECRSGGQNGDYTIVYSFDRVLTAVDNAGVTQGTATISSTTLGPELSQFTVNLTGVSNAQHLMVTLNGVHGTTGTVLNNQLARMDVLIGDTTGNGAVNSSDIAQTQSESGHTLTSGNFREDVTANGMINSSDIGLVQSRSGTALP